MGGWSRNHIFIVFEGLSSGQIVLRVDKTLHESVFTRFGQGELIAAAVLKLGGAFYILQGEEDPEMLPQVLDLDLNYGIDGKGCSDQDIDPDVDGKGFLHFEQLEESVLEQSRPSERSGLARKPSRTFRCNNIR